MKLVQVSKSSKDKILKGIFLNLNTGESKQGFSRDKGRNWRISEGTWIALADNYNL